MVPILAISKNLKILILTVSRRKLGTRELPTLLPRGAVMHFVQYFGSGWNIEAIILLAVLWFGLMPTVACLIAVRVFEERERGEVTGRSTF